MNLPVEHDEGVSKAASIRVTARLELIPKETQRRFLKADITVQTMTSGYF